MRSRWAMVMLAGVVVSSFVTIVIKVYGLVVIFAADGWLNKLMLAVGRIAAQNLLRTDMTLGRLRQQVHRFGLSQVPLVATYHPAYLLRTPTDKRKAWEDLKFAREVCARG